MSTPQTPPAGILVVDDTPANLQLLVKILEEAGYDVRPVTSGAHALRAVRTNPPDLILLDITMPGMDGYETCQRLKHDPAGSDIPVLFISALTETDDKVKAFAAGGVDYVSKPFQHGEVLARVATHLELRRQKHLLEESLRHERELERLRDKLTHMIAHDMRSPLQAVRLALDLLRDPGSPPDLGLIQSATNSVETLIEMVTQMLEVSQLEAKALKLKPESIDMAELARDVIESLQPLAATTSTSVETTGETMAVVDQSLIRRVIANLVGNAYKWVPKQGKVLVKVSQVAHLVRVEVIDNGRGIPAEYHQKIFEKFGQVDGDKKRAGYGLGLTFAKMAVEAHQGQIGVISEPGQGSTFWFTLPRTPLDAASR